MTNLDGFFAGGPVTVRPTDEHMAEYGRTRGAWSAADIAQARTLLERARVLGTDPLVPTLGALADYLEQNGLALQGYDRVGQVEQLASLVGWGGPLTEYLVVPGVANLQINGADEDLIVEYATGQRDVVRGARLSVEWVEWLVRCWLARRGIAAVDGVMPAIAHGTVDGLRFTYFGPEHARRGVTLQVRLPLPRPSLADLVERGLLTRDAAQWLSAFMRVRVNMLISGGTNSGKTTLVNALLGEVDGMERVGVIEAFAELDVSGRPGTVAYQLGLNAEEADLARLLHANLYNSVQRLVLGEARGGEAAQLILAMNSGVAGCLATIHAESAEEAPRRLAQCARMSPAMQGLALADVYRIVAGLGLIVVQVQQRPDGKRRVTQIVEVFDTVGESFKRYEIFKLNAAGELVFAEPGLSARLWERLRTAGVTDLPMGRGGKGSDARGKRER